MQRAEIDTQIATGATVYFGAVVCTPSAYRRVGQVLARSVIAVAEDQYHFSFGNGVGLSGFAVSTGTTQTDRLCTMPPVVIAPGGELLFAMIAPSGASTAWDGEIMMGYWER